MKSLGVSADSYGGLLSSVLLNKLPQEVRLLISRKVPELDWSLDILLKELGDESQARERVVVDKPTLDSSSAKGERTPPTAATLVAGTGPACSTCCYCHQDHLPKDCRVVSQVEARKQILLKAGRCFNCLRRSHRSQDCRSKTRCTSAIGSIMCRHAQVNSRSQGRHPAKVRVRRNQ